MNKLTIRIPRNIKVGRPSTINYKFKNKYHCQHVILYYKTMDPIRFKLKIRSKKTLKYKICKNERI